MKSSLLLIILFIIGLIAGIGLFSYQASLPNVNYLNEYMQEQLNEIGLLDTNTNELALRNRIHIEKNYDAITHSMTTLKNAVVDISESVEGRVVLADPLFAKRYQSLTQEVEVKAELIENFKTRFAVLRNSERYAPVVGARLVKVAEENNLQEIATIYRDAIISVLTYTNQNEKDTTVETQALLAKLQATESEMPEASLTDIIEFTRHASTVFNEKDFVDVYLVKALQSSTQEDIAELENAWDLWVAKFDKPKAILDKVIIVYVAYILLILAIALFLLRSLYKNLEQKVEQKTIELQATFDQLNESERQLMQAEKMSSLGQLVAGIAHEVNTPLGYVSSNLAIIRRNFDSVESLCASVKKLNAEALAGGKNAERIRKVLREIILCYRDLDRKEAVADINDLLGDSSQGLDEISQLVISLKDFSRIDKGDTAKVDVHESLKATLKMCTTLLSGRKVVQLYDESVPEVQFSAAQLNQVFLNILTNAAHATLTVDGTINIATELRDNRVAIEFKDNGCGMDENTQQKMFDPFFTTKGISEGSGLGMSITYKLIKGHGGDINVTSAVGEGTTITVLLPVAADH